MDDEDVVIVPLADEGEISQQEHAASLPDNPPFYYTGFQREEARKPDTKPPVGPNSSS